MKAGVTGGCTRTLEPIRGCPFVGALLKVLTRGCWQIRAIVRERASGMVRTPGALTNPQVWRQLLGDFGLILLDQRGSEHVATRVV